MPNKNALKELDKQRSQMLKSMGNAASEADEIPEPEVHLHPATEGTAIGVTVPEPVPDEGTDDPDELPGLQQLKKNWRHK